MWACERCGATFDTADVRCDDPSPDGVSLTRGAYKEQICPKCGHEIIDEARECPVCHDWYLLESTVCGECADVLADGLERLRQSMGLTQDDFEQAIVEHFRW